MIRSIGFATALWIFLGAGSVHAALQSPVTVGGTEWLQPLDFVSYSWNDISTVCNSTTGVCSGSLGGSDLTGWTWASVDDMNALFNYYIGTLVMGPGPSLNSAILTAATDWLDSMLADGFLTTYEDLVNSNETSISGKLRTSYPSNSTSSYVGRMVVFRPNASYQYATWADTTYTHIKAYPFSHYGAWLYRGDLGSISVPLTDTLALVGLGLCALGLTGGTRKAKRFSIPA